MGLFNLLYIKNIKCMDLDIFHLIIKRQIFQKSLFHLQEKYMTHMVIWMEMN